MINIFRPSRYQAILAFFRSRIWVSSDKCRVYDFGQSRDPEHGWLSPLIYEQITACTIFHLCSLEMSQEMMGSLV